MIPDHIRISLTYFLCRFDGTNIMTLLGVCPCFYRWFPSLLYHCLLLIYIYDAVLETRGGGGGFISCLV